MQDRTFESTKQRAPSAGYSIGDWGFAILDLRLGIGDLRFWIDDFGLTIGDLQFSIDDFGLGNAEID